MDPYYDYFFDYRNFNKAYKYTVLELREYESICINILEFKLNLYTHFDFIKYIFSMGIVFNDDTLDADSNGSSCKTSKNSTCNSTKSSSYSPNKIVFQKFKNFNAEVTVTSNKFLEKVYYLCEEILQITNEGNLPIFIKISIF